MKTQLITAATLTLALCQTACITTVHTDDDPYSYPHRHVHVVEVSRPRPISLPSPRPRPTIVTIRRY